MGVHFDWALWMLFAFWLTGIYFSFGPHFTSHYPPRKKHCHISRLTCPVEKRQRRNDAATPKTPTWESIGCRRDGCASFQRKIYNYNPLLVGSHTLVHFEGLVSVLLGKSFFFFIFRVGNCELQRKLCEKRDWFAWDWKRVSRVALCRWGHVGYDLSGMRLRDGGPGPPNLVTCVTVFYFLVSLSLNGIVLAEKSKSCK